jgi:DNA primase
VSLTPAFLDELRARTLLSALVGKTVKLTKAGREFKGCCPFHSEKTPSFYVNDDKSFYHCFGCSAHGDAIRWMTEQQGLPFIDAVKELAQAAGMEMPAQDRQSVERAERAKGLHDLMADAAQFFTDQLNGIAGAEARAVLEKRAVKPDTARAFGMGYSPDSRGKLREELKTYGDPALIESGMLIKVDDKEPYDRFRGRLMIPIRDPRGRVIAFGGRVIGHGEPKYLNSPDTPLFDKGRTLYNLDRAAPASRKSGRIIVVEGYMDVIALAQAGFGEAVAPLGTALTEHQLERLWRLSDVPILCFDGDSAGHKAAIRAALRALPIIVPGKSLSFVTLPYGQDPDDLIQSEGAEKFASLIADPISLSDIIWRTEVAGINPASPDDRAALKSRLGHIADLIKDPDAKREYRKTLLDKFFSAFGFNAKNIERVRSAMAEASRRPRRGLPYALQRAVLLGLMKYPFIIRQLHEDVCRLHFVDRYLVAWRDHLVDAAFSGAELSESMVEQILSKTDVSPIEQRDLSKDLAFSFFHRNADEEIAVRDLRRVITILVDEREAEQALLVAQSEFEKNVTDDAFAAQSRCQREVSAIRSELKAWLELIDEAA